MAVGWHDEAFEGEGGEFVVYSAVVGVLHGHHPSEVVEEFVDNVGEAVAGLGDVDGGVFGGVGVEACREHEGVGGYGAIDDVFVVVAGVVPSAGHGEDGAFGSLCGGGGFVDEDGVVGVSCGSCPLAAVLRCYGH